MIRSLVVFAFAVVSLSAQTVRFATSLGNIDVNLAPESAPATVQNFLNYVNKGAYNNSFIHRSVPGFIIQGGGYTFINGGVGTIPQDPPVVNEYKISNTRGTLAMAKLGGDPNSATNQWFFNLANNGSNLDNQNGGFTVFGRVADSTSLGVMDRIAAVPVYASNSPFDAVPLRNYTGAAITTNNLVMITSITVLAPTPAISSNGIVAASDFGAYTTAAPGSFIEIYGSNLAGTTRQWASTDFTDRKAPTTLDGVSVSIGGKSAFVSYVSPNQVNVQVPSDVATGGAVPVVVTYNGRAGAQSTLTVQTTSGGVLAPETFKVGDKQFAAAFHANGSLVSNGSVPGIPAAPVTPGETLVFYGLGFGPVTPGPVAGQLATAGNTVNAQVQFLINDIPAVVSYAGLSIDLVGVYQFNVAIPAGLATGDATVKILVNGTTVGQTLYLPIKAQ